jgi:PilZ domain
MVVMATIERVSESRRSPRRRLRLSTSVATHPNGTLAIVIQNLSATGLLFESHVQFEVGEELSVELAREVSANGRIAWRRGNLYGCEFDMPLSQGAVGAALLKGEARSATQERERIIEGDDRWSGSVRLGLILGGSALLWAIITWAVTALT